MTQPDWSKKPSLIEHAREFIKKRDGKPGNVFLEPIHRIDRVCSGIVVMAKTSKSLSRCMQSLRDQVCTKEYIAVVEGLIPQDEGKLENYIVHGDFRAIKSSESDTQAKKATLTYKVILRTTQFTVLRVQLHTGRYHQIRAQFAWKGHPILGDQKYGSEVPFAEGAIALHHNHFCFPHPTTKETILIDCKVPPKWLLKLNDERLKGL
ncbi:MAG: RNA pseudouridine synthase [Parachlamydiales bacterium]|nr:RNA pseudouridine synthase [Parachlamydiales bacterium]